MAFIFFLRHWEKVYLIHTLNKDFQLLKLLCLNFSDEDTSKAENRNLSIWINLQIDEMLERMWKGGCDNRDVNFSYGST